MRKILVIKRSTKSPSTTAPNTFRVQDGKGKMVPTIFTSYGQAWQYMEDNAIAGGLIIDRNTGTSSPKRASSPDVVRDKMMDMLDAGLDITAGCPSAPRKSARRAVAPSTPRKAVSGARRAVSVVSDAAADLASDFLTASSFAQWDGKFVTAEATNGQVYIGELSVDVKENALLVFSGYRGRPMVLDFSDVLEVLPVNKSNPHTR